MGINLDVESITVAPSRRRPGPREVHIANQARLDAIRMAFGWKAQPWNEPSEVVGAQDHMSYSLTYLFWTLAETITDRLPDLDRHIAHLMKVMEIISTTPQDDEPELERSSTVFPQFSALYRETSHSCYLPVDFPGTFPLAIVYPDGSISDYVLTIGSSIRLREEVAFIHEIVSRSVEKFGPDIHPNHSPHQSWSNVAFGADIMLQAAEDSVRLNLPLEISW